MTTDLHSKYLKEIEMREGYGLQAKPIEDAEFVEVLIAQIKDVGHEHRTDSLRFFVFGTLPGTTSAAGVKAKFLRRSSSGPRSSRRSHQSWRSSTSRT